MTGAIQSGEQRGIITPEDFGVNRQLTDATCFAVRNGTQFGEVKLAAMQAMLQGQIAQLILPNPAAPQTRCFAKQNSFGNNSHSVSPKTGETRVGHTDVEFRHCAEFGSTSCGVISEVATLGPNPFCRVDRSCRR